ncbi:fibrinogen alpha-1 chain-like isoform X2 [Gopherus flavomarginatus]|uniref:fibrinogen alpha-1 chain-like isoform X2 n=1 Tax=Gopherus flavomarginatus TaxID=286002 RepID=UPI0021CBB30C|nr:fibrinogen alpha-1 chain-like isoform X2 [Gopherus flavomarginatus]
MGAGVTADPCSRCLGAPLLPSRSQSACTRGAGSQDSWVLFPTLGGDGGLGVRTPGFYSPLWEGSGGCESGLLGSIPRSGRGVGAENQDSWVLFPALGGEWGSGNQDSWVLFPALGGEWGLGIRTPGFYSLLWEGSGGLGIRTPGFYSLLWEGSGGWESGLLGSIPRSGRGVGVWESRLLRSIPCSGRGVGAGNQDSWVLFPALGGDWGLGVRTPGFYSLLWEGSGGWESGLLGSIPRSERGVGAGNQDSWVLFPALGGDWGLGIRTPGFYSLLWEGSGGWESGLLGSIPCSGRGVGVWESGLLGFIPALLLTYTLG